VAHLIWDWNGTLLDDLALVVSATNASLATVGGPCVTSEDHRRDFCRPVSDYYAHVLGRPVAAEEFLTLDRTFHEFYRAGLHGCRLAVDALDAIAAWRGTQSLLSMFFHYDLLEVVTRHGLHGRLARVDGLRDAVGGGPKAPHLKAHLQALAVRGEECVLIGDSVDDAEAAEHVGAKVILYCGGFTDEARLRSTGMPVAASLLEAVEHAVRSSDPGVH
jgi:phosphoglycolate phosphatase-like HAD superfamily hydrolase